MNTLQSIFDDIYEHNKWNGGSGPGSNKSNTVEYVSHLNGLIRSLGVNSFLDVGCGDWQLGEQFDMSGVRYKGIDVSKRAIEIAKSKAPSETDISVGTIFEVDESFDFVHIKDVLQHLPMSECERILSHSSRHKYVYVVNDHCESNFDTDAGGYRPINVLHWPNSQLVRMFNIGGFNKSAVLINNK